jgi:hypothetical protein
MIPPFAILKLFLSELETIGVIAQVHLGEFDFE